MSQAEESCTSSCINSYEVNSAELQEHLLSSSYAYIQYVLGATQSNADLVPTPEFHVTMFTMFTNAAIKRCVAACPRGHAKTTLMKIAIGRIIYGSNSDLNIGYLSHSSPLATKALADIYSMLRAPNMVAVFGEPVFSKEQLDRGEYTFKLGGHIFNMSSFGANSQIRGYNTNNRRLDILIVDDLEDSGENASDVLFLKLKRWFYSDVMKALSHGGRVLQIGNIVNKNSIVNENCADPRWHSMKLSAIKADGTPLWPELNSFDDLLAEYNSYAKNGLAGQWCAEMLNDPNAANTLSIDLERIGRKPKPEPSNSGHSTGFITIDPAISTAAWGHAQTIAVHCYYDDPAKTVVPYWQVVDTESKYGQSPVMLYEAVHRLCDKWGITIVGFEAEAYQAALKPIFEYMDEVNGRQGLLEYIPLSTMKKSKASRIKSFVDLLYQGVYYLSNEDKLAMSQLLAFDPTRRDNSDDLIDVESYGVQMLAKHQERILQARRYSAFRVDSSQSSALLSRIAEASEL